MKKKYISLLLECIDLIKENNKNIDKYTRFYLSQGTIWYTAGDIDLKNTIKILEEGSLPQNYICSMLLKIGDTYSEINNSDNPSLSE